jgi:crotonobetainyl-CoA:carnitine CoA-transferase CaiB-like acyl-CoA transferase
MEPFNREQSEPGSCPSRPLDGLTVIEIGHSVAAPFAGQVLGDLGATVIKVENPAGGDDARNWGPPFWNGSSATFQSLNRNKKSVELDLKSPADLEKLRDLMRTADVVLQNMRPGLVQRYQIDAAASRADNARLVYFNLGAFGDRGPMKDQPGYDPLMQAFAGIMTVTGEDGRPPVRVGPSIIDIGSGLWAVVGILSALLRRAVTGEGCTVDGSLYETALSWMTIPIASLIASVTEPGRSGTETPMLAPYKAYEACDGYVVIAAGNNNLFRKLCAVLGSPDLAADPDYETNALRVANRAALNKRIDDIVRTGTAADWADRLSAAGVPCAPIQTVGQVISHAQTKAVEMISPTPDGSLELVRLPLRFDGERPAIRSNPPVLGADNAILDTFPPRNHDHDR